MKPSTDYVTWLMAPEQKEFRRRLNEEWEPDVGDSARDTTSGDILIIVRVMRDGSIDATWLGKPYRYSEPAWKRELQWLPDLGQLLAMIGGRGARVELVRTFDGKWLAYAWVVGGPEMFEGYSPVAAATSPEIAAASLLAKLWEGSE